MTKTNGKTSPRKKAAAKKAPAQPPKAPPSNPQLLRNFDIIQGAIRDNQISAIIGVAVLKNGIMIDMFATSNELLMEYAALVQVENLRDNMKGMQARRMAAERQAAADAKAHIGPPAANPAPPPDNRKQRRAAATQG